MSLPTMQGPCRESAAGGRLECWSGCWAWGKQTAARPQGLNGPGVGGRGCTMNWKHITVSYLPSGGIRGAQWPLGRGVSSAFSFKGAGGERMGCP